MSDYFIQDLREDGDASFDLVPRITTFEQLQSYFHLDVRRDKGWDATPNGQACWKLVGFYLRTGIASYIAKVIDAASQPLNQFLVFRSWSGAPRFDSPVSPGYSQEGVAGWTNINGDAGFPYAGTSVVKDEGGPDMIWVSASPPGQQPQFSDAAIRLGWYGGTDHLTANPIFQFTVKSEPLPPSGEEYLVNINEAGVITSHIQWTQGTPPAGIPVLGLYRLGQVVAWAPWKEGAPE